MVIQGFHFSAKAKQPFNFKSESIGGADQMGMEQIAKAFQEKRRQPRISISNIVSCILFDENKKRIGNEKGRILNLSQNGALLETSKPLSGSFVVLTSINLNGRILKVKGSIANTRKSDKEGLYLTGIEYIGPKDEQRSAVIAFIKIHNYLKYAT